MRPFCWTCHRPTLACFCSMTRPFESSAQFGLIVHPYEANSTVGTAWVLRRSITNLKWFRSTGADLDTDPSFLKLLNDPLTAPFLLFPGPQSFNLSLGSNNEWAEKISTHRKPLFFVVDGTWTQVSGMLRKSKLLSALPRVSFETTQLSEYGFKTQPHPYCLSSVEGVHRVIEILASRKFNPLPEHREHDQMIEIFRSMVKFQLTQERNPRTTRGFDSLSKS